jgi:PAS domain S-box-containing protein
MTQPEAEMTVAHDLLFTALPDPCLLISPQNGCVRAVNPAAIRIFGSPAEHLIHHHLTALLPALQPLLGVLAADPSQTVHCRGPGDWTWIGVRSYPVGALQLVQFFDVTAHRAAEVRRAALYTLTAALSQTLSVADIAGVVLAQGLTVLGAVTGSVFVLDEAGAALQLVGAVGYEAAFLARWQQVPLTVDTLICEVLRSGPQTALVTDLDRRYPDHVQRTRPSVLVTAVPLVFAGRTLGVVTFGFGRSALDAAEEGLVGVLAEQLAQSLERVRLLVDERRVRERYRALIEATQQYVWTNSPEGELRGEQPGWARLTGQTQAAYQGYGWTERLHPDDRAAAIETWQQSVRNLTPYESNQRVRGQDGQYRHFLVRAIPLLSTEGQLLEWVGLHTDVTVLTQAQQALQGWGQELERRVVAKTQELQASNEALGAFAYSVSHDLRAPVRHVNSFAGLLSSRLGDEPKARRYLDAIIAAGQRMDALIEALLELARSGAAALHRTEVDLAQLVAAARADLGAPDEERIIQWQLGALPAVQADRALLRQVLVNLLGNAVKYSRGRSPAVIEVWAEERPGEVVVTVRDNGAGFDPRYRERLFGVFQRLHRQSDFEGLGVGLANVRRIVEKHGGQVWAQGQPGEGATFAFSLPRDGD